MSTPPIPAERRNALSEEERRNYWRYVFAGQALGGILADPDVNDVRDAGDAAIAATDYLLSKLEGSAK